MNVLILTPDAVGSTLLQRMLTIYMQFHEFDRPVINLHELTNGLAKYYSPEFNQEIVSKKTLKDWGYFQSLQQVVELLDSVDHYKTSRLAHYHIRRRGDTLEKQIPFYNYLNENFYIIACRRNNVFEHAVSMTLATVTKKLNVYDPWEKIDTFYDMYKSGITLDPMVFVKQLNGYKLYLDWSEQYFNVSSYFNYEQHVPKLEEFILDLPFFASQPRRMTWHKNFGMSFNSWNKINYLRSSPALLESCQDWPKLLLERQDYTNDYHQYAPEHWPPVTTQQDINDLPDDIKQQWVQNIIRRDGMIGLLSQQQQQQLAQYRHGHQQAQQTIQQMINLGVMISGPPIKKQTLLDKSQIIKNFNELIEIYNQWIAGHPEVGVPVDSDMFARCHSEESNFWQNLFDSRPESLPNQQ